MKYYTVDIDYEQNPLNAEHSEYRVLWASVLLQAVRDMDSRYLGEREQALNYLYSRRTDIGSFNWVCDALDLDRDHIQQMAVTRSGRSKLIGNNVGNRKRTTEKDN